MLPGMTRGPESRLFDFCSMYVGLVHMAKTKGLLTLPFHSGLAFHGNRSDSMVCSAFERRRSLSVRRGHVLNTPCQFSISLDRLVMEWESFVLRHMPTYFLT